MRRIETTIDIATGADAVWQVLMDFPAYPMWNPFIRTITGRANPGARLAVLIQPPGKGEMQFKPLVQSVEEKRIFSWLGHLLIPGVFSGRHEFRLEPTACGTRLHHRESFSGMLVPLVWNGMEAPTRAGFTAMNEALRIRAEALGKN